MLLDESLLALIVKDDITCASDWVVEYGVFLEKVPLDRLDTMDNALEHTTFAVPDTTSSGTKEVNNELVRVVKSATDGS